MDSLAVLFFLGLVLAIIVCPVFISYTKKTTETTIDNNPLEEEGANETNDLCGDETQKASTDNANCEKNLSVSSVEIEKSIKELKAQIKELKDKQLSTVIKGVLWGLLIWSAISVIIFVIYANSHHSYY